MFKRFLTLSLGLGFLFVLAGCSSGGNILTGGSKKSPDEFQVAVSPPLTLPPNFTLRPSDEETVQNTLVTSEELLGSSSSANASVFDTLFGTGEAVSGIREIVDEETLGIQIERRIPLDILFGRTSNVGPTLDSEGETLRIRKSQLAGVAVTETPTLAVDAIDDTPLLLE